VAVAGKRVILIRRRETFEDLTSGQDMSGIDEKLIRRLH
jgi:hypothetical protein